MSETISVILPVHAGIEPQHLSRALQSLSEQTRPAEELVLIEDGHLPNSLRAVVDAYNPSVTAVKRIQLLKNGGAGVANGCGLDHATGDLIAKMDADDISLPYRFERQVLFMQGSGADVCSSAMLQFEEDESHVVSVRVCPWSHDAIARRMKTNNPMNHPASMYRRICAVEAGGYSGLRYMQDYDLFARMLVRGATFRNIEEPLVAFRADATMYGRRTSRAMDRCEWRLQRNLVAYGVIGPGRGIFNFLVRSACRRLPIRVIRWMYRLMDREVG